MSNEDFLKNFEGMNDLGQNMMYNNRDLGSNIDERVIQFYSKLTDYNQSWHDLEEENYRCYRVGQFNFEKQVDQMQDTPNLQYYKIATSRNGGPIAFLLKDNLLLLSRKEDTKNTVFIFSAYGQLINKINMKEKLPNINSDQRWVVFDFTDEEDLFMVTDDGLAILIDCKTTQINQQVQLGRQFHAKRLIDSRFDQITNTLVLRDQTQQFYLIKNICSNLSQLLTFQKSADLEERVGDDYSSTGDFILIPADKAGSRQTELFVADPEEGFFQFKIHNPLTGENSEDAKHYTNLGDFNNKPQREPSLGRIEKFALSSNQKLLAIYSNTEFGDLIVAKSDLSEEIIRHRTNFLGAEGLVWCGSDVTVLEYSDKVIMVSPQNMTEILKCGYPKTLGQKCLTEIDGLRIINSDGTFFLERVQKCIVDTFKIASITPAAKLLEAIKQLDFRTTRADEIIRELSKESLIEGIETLLEIAKLEHWDVPIMKHILRTACFAKTFTDASDFDPNRYVNVAKHMIVLTHLRHSKVCGRAITYQQFEKYKPKRLLKLLYKFRDYQLAILLIDNLNLKQYLPQVYEVWTIDALKNSTLEEHLLKERLREKFDSLKRMIAQEQDIPLHSTNSGQSKANQLILDNLKMNIDFTKLANVAHTCKKKNISDFLIQYEQSIVKKIPFLLQTENYSQALEFALKSGDPNIIDKVFEELNKKTQTFIKTDQNQNLFEKTFDLINKFEDGIRHFRNFAKKNRNYDLLEKISRAQIHLETKLALEKGKAPATNFPIQISLTRDMTYGRLFLQDAYKAEKMGERTECIKKSAQFLENYNKDDFYKNLVNELDEVSQMQLKFYKQNPTDSAIMRSSLADFITKKLISKQTDSQLKESENEVKQMRINYKLPDSTYWSIVFKAYCQDASPYPMDHEEGKKRWARVIKMVNDSKPLIPYLTMGDLLIDAGNKILAVQAIRKEKKYETRVQKLIECQAWLEAVEETFSNKKNSEFENFLEQIRALGPAFVEDFIKEQQQKKR